MRKRLVWKTEKLSKYTGRVADNTRRTARELVTNGEVVLQRKVRQYTPRDSGRLYSSIQTEHGGRWESVRSSISDSMSDVTSFMSERNVGYGTGRGGRIINFMLPSYAVRNYILEGSVYSNLSYASDVEYDTGIYNKRNGGQPIRPKDKKALAFITKGGKAIVVASVKGYRGKHMFAKAAAYVSDSPNYLNNQSRPVLMRWRARSMIVRPR